MSCIQYDCFNGIGIIRYSIIFAGLKVRGDIVKNKGKTANDGC